MTIRAQLLRKFADFVYRHAYAEEYLDSAIATQIKVLREQRGMTQVELAGHLGMKQSQIARMENVNHTGWQIRTLKRVAKAFDLFLVVKFESFGGALPDIENFNRRALERPSFEDDPIFAENTIDARAHIEELTGVVDKGFQLQASTSTAVIHAEGRFGIKSAPHAA